MVNTQPTFNLDINIYLPDTPNNRVLAQDSGMISGFSSPDLSNLTENGMEPELNTRMFLARNLKHIKASVLEFIDGSGYTDGMAIELLIDRPNLVSDTNPIIYLPTETCILSMLNALERHGLELIQSIKKTKNFMQELTGLLLIEKLYTPELDITELDIEYNLNSLDNTFSYQMAVTSNIVGQFGFSQPENLNLNVITSTSGVILDMLSTGGGIIIKHAPLGQQPTSKIITIHQSFYCVSEATENFQPVEEIHAILGTIWYLVT
jgi:hypothetical protein